MKSVKIRVYVGIWLVLHSHMCTINNSVITQTIIRTHSALLWVYLEQHSYLFFPLTFLPALAIFSSGKYETIIYNTYHIHSTQLLSKSTFQTHPISVGYSMSWPNYKMLMLFSWLTKGSSNCFERDHIYFISLQLWQKHTFFSFRTFMIFSLLYLIYQFAKILFLLLTLCSSLAMPLNIPSKQNCYYSLDHIKFRNIQLFHLPVCSSLAILLHLWYNFLIWVWFPTSKFELSLHWDFASLLIPVHSLQMFHFHKSMKISGNLKWLYHTYLKRYIQDLEMQQGWSKAFLLFSMKADSHIIGDLIIHKMPN